MWIKSFIALRREEGAEQTAYQRWLPACCLLSCLGAVYKALAPPSLSLHQDALVSSLQANHFTLGAQKVVDRDASEAEPTDPEARMAQRLHGGWNAVGVGSQGGLCSE